MMFASALPVWKFFCLPVLLIKWENTKNIVIVDADDVKCWFYPGLIFSNWKLQHHWWQTNKKKPQTEDLIGQMRKKKPNNHASICSLITLSNNLMPPSAKQQNATTFVLWLVWKRKKNSILPVCALTKKLCAISKWACSNLNKMLLLRGRVVY